MASSASSSSSSYRNLEITLISAKDLKDVNMMTKLEVYAVVMLSGDRRTKQRTPIDRDGRRNPTWNCPLWFQVPAATDTGRLSLDIYLRCERALGDRDVGEVHVPIKELESSGGGSSGDGKSAKFVSYQVRRASGRAKGVLHFSYKFGDILSAPAPKNPVYPPPQEAKVDEPVLAYPVRGAGTTYPPPPASASVPYPPPAGYPAYRQTPTQNYGYGSPQVGGNGYGAPPPPTYGYGYGAPPVVQPQRPPKKNKMGFGTGLLGGALGGLLIGDMLSDASAYNAGYDAGFDNGGDFGGGFDF